MFKIRPFLKNLLAPILLFITIAALISAIWFKQGLMYGGAEVGLLTYNPQRSEAIQQYIWWAQSAPGMLVPHFITGVPFYFVLSLLQPILSSANLQALIFLFLLFLMGFGMYQFALIVLGKDKKLLAILAAFFYLFNSYMMVEVWHRFLYTHFFLAAFLPIFLIFWWKWITKGRFLFLIIFLLFNLAASYMFGNLASVLTVWLSLFLITATSIVFPWKGKTNALRVSFRFFIGAIFWFLTNFWWLIPVFTVATGLLPEQHSSEDNINTLINISRQTILPYTLQFANPFYLYYTSELGAVFNNIFFRIIPWIPTAVIFIGLITAFKRKVVAGFGVLYILSIIFSKGAATPFGYPYIWSFLNIYSLGVIRNPFEKLGIMLPLFGSILFVVGLETILAWGRKKIGFGKSVFLIVIIFTSIFIFAHPVFFGTVLKKPVEPVLVEVPASYKQADEWFKLQADKDGNILHLPYSGKDVVTYNWEYGYHGVDINELLFNFYPSITRNLGMKTIDDTLSSLSFLFYDPFLLDKDQLLRQLENFNVKFILLHKDVKWTDISTFGKDIKIIDTQKLENSLNILNFLEKKVSFGELVIYKLKDEFYKEKIIFADFPDLIYPGEKNYLQVVAGAGSEIITPQKNDSSEISQSKVKSISIFPQSSFDYQVASKSAMVVLANKMPLDSKDPDSEITKLRKMENYFLNSGELISQKLVKNIIEASEDLVKIYAGGIDDSMSETNINKYEEAIKKVFNKNFKSLSLLKLYKSQIETTFYMHLYILEKLSNKLAKQNAKILKINEILIKGLKENNLFPQSLNYLEVLDQEINRKIIQFEIPIKSKYELQMYLPNSSDLYPDFLSNLDMRINSYPLNGNGKIEKNIISFGQFNLDNDLEISYNLLFSPNLVPSLDKFFKLGRVEVFNQQTFRLSSDLGGLAYLESPIDKVSGRDIYKISFEALLEKGDEFYVEIMQDSEDFDLQKEYQTIQPDECSRHNCYPIRLDPQKNGWQSYSLSTTPLNLISKKANIRIFVFSKIENGQQVDGSILIRNLNVNRIFDGSLFLTKKISNTTDNSSSGRMINLIKQSPVNYTGKIQIRKPTFLFFKETFHPGWILTLFQGNNVYKIDPHYMGNLYNNSYFLDKIGEYNFKLEFEPQREVDKGLILTVTGWILILVIFIWEEFRKIP